MGDAEIEGVTIDWTCTDCNKIDPENGNNVYRSDSVRGNITDKCDSCGKTFNLN